MSTRSTRSRGVTAKAKTASEPAKRGSEGSSRYFKKKSGRGKRTEPDEDEDEVAVAGDAEADGGDGEDGEDGSESETESLHSDALDDEDDDDDDAESRRKKNKQALKRKRGSVSSPKKAPAKKAKPASPAKKRKIKKARKDEDEDEQSDLELEEGQEIVGVVIQAPKTGRVPPGQISKNTLDFLLELKKPECNDREWFKLHEPVYRLAESEWKAFVDHFTDLLVDADPQIPHLPPKDVIHRIYRDVRFSNDKTPYKAGFSASFSRSGRKGIFAGFKPGGESILAAGTWCPGKNELATMRINLQRSSKRLRDIISAPDFEALFGPARPHPKGARQNIFGMDDELKVAPKGVDKTHKDIDLLKCRSFAVVYRFTDKQVLSSEFKNELAHVAGLVRPFVHCLNDLMTIQGGGDSSSSSGSDDEGGDEDPEDS